MTWGALRIEGATGARHELERFADLQACGAASRPRTPDLSLWDPKRISAWRTELEKPAPPPLAVLRVPKIRLEVAVLPGTDDFTLNRASVTSTTRHCPGRTATPESPGTATGSSGA